VTTTEAPFACNREMYFDHPENVFYGTDDGAQDGSFREFEKVRAHYDSVAPERREDIHLISVVGGLYGLNLIPLWKPKRITFFDINPAAVSYFRVVRRVWIGSRDVQHFLQQLTDGKYPVDNAQEEFIRENISMKQRGCLPRERGSTKRPYEQSWQYAFEHFDLTKKLLAEAPLEIRNDPMESESFSNYIRGQNNVWIYASNIAEFHYFGLEFDDPANCVMLQIIYPDDQPAHIQEVIGGGNELQILDLAPLAGGPVKVHFEIPLRAERLAERIDG
jgi:hypothetical protein